MGKQFGGLESFCLSKQKLKINHGVRNFNYFLADASTQLSLYKLGYKYYTKKSLNYFGSDILLKVVDSYFENDVLMCTCKDTLNFTYKLKAMDVLLNV